MNSYQKTMAALNHQDTPVPIDFGSNVVTGMHVTCVEALRDYYGLEKRPVKVSEPYQMLGDIEEDLKQAIGADVECVWPDSTIFGFRNENWKEWRTPWGQVVLVSEHFNTITSGDAELIYPQGDKTVPPSATMPGGGYFFDTIIRQGEFDEDDPNVEDNLQEFSAIDETTIAYYAAETKRARASGRGVFANFGGTGLGDIALVTGPMLKDPKGIRDIAEWYMSTAIRQDFVREIFDRQTALAIENLGKIKTAVADNVDAVFICGTDFGTQTSQFCSVDTFREVWFPYYQRVNDWIHANTNWRTFKHCCGAAEPFYKSFIECGFDIINPVQCSATGMDPEMLKKKYGNNLVFWGGGVDTQKVLPYGTPEEVRAQVLERCRIFAPGGGFVFNAIHNVQAKTPVRNIVAMIKAVHEFNGVHP
ncbi:MAG: uroporphyrinogen decarboxylase family protein [Propionivibrio sp.]